VSVFLFALNLNWLISLFIRKFLMMLNKLYSQGKKNLKFFPCFPMDLYIKMFSLSYVKNGESFLFYTKSSSKYVFAFFSCRVAKSQPIS